LNIKPNIEKPFGNSPVLDILHIVYEDFVLGRLTPIEKLNRIMYNTYPFYGRPYLKNLINILIHSEWFDKSPSNTRLVHLKERGVEVYLSMVHNYRAEKRAIEIKQLTVWILIFSVFTLTASIVTIIIMLLELK